MYTYIFKFPRTRTTRQANTTIMVQPSTRNVRPAARHSERSRASNKDGRRQRRPSSVLDGQMRLLLLAHRAPAGRGSVGRRRRQHAAAVATDKKGESFFSILYYLRSETWPQRTPGERRPTMAPRSCPGWLRGRSRRR